MVGGLRKAMNSTNIFTLIVVPLAVALINYWSDIRLSGLFSWWRKENMPAELRNASIFLNEADIACSWPVPLHGRVDQVFKNRLGKLVPLDTKSRSKDEIYKEDVIQLSVYRLILSQQFSEQVCDYGYVRLVVCANGQRRIRYVKVRLLSQKEVITLYHQHNHA